jgi:ParB family transcriptional regulator, chromosome partitioning protein
MSKRTDAIRSLFTQPQTAVLSVDNTGPDAYRVPSGTVRALKDSFSEIERENDALRLRLSASASIVEIAPGLIDASPVADRFSEAEDASFETLKASMAERGQEVPVLVREHPTLAGRFQSAYGHRRIRAAKELGRPVQAIIRKLSDVELVIAQGIENSARQDLSFIERAVFAARLESSGHDRVVIQDALSIDRAEASKLIAVARAIPSDIIAAIGRASKIGRGRWQALADACAKAGALKRARHAIAKDGIADMDSDTRFLSVWASARKPDRDVDGSGHAALSVTTSTGQAIATARQSGRDLKLSLDKSVDAAFAAFLVSELPVLFDTFASRRRLPDSAGG